jgi:hypothetical protein
LIPVVFSWWLVWPAICLISRLFRNKESHTNMTRSPLSHSLPLPLYGRRSFHHANSGLLTPTINITRPTLVNRMSRPLYLFLNGQVDTVVGISPWPSFSLASYRLRQCVGKTASFHLLKFTILKRNPFASQ